MGVRRIDQAFQRQHMAIAEPAQWPAGVPADWSAYWHDLPADAYLLDGGRYRSRRHSCFVIEPGSGVVLAPHRAHWQSVDYNALHGGIERHFEPLPSGWLSDPRLATWLAWLGERADRLRGSPQRWFAEVHAFRIDTTGGIGRPTPEGAHRDGVDLVAVTLVARHGIKGGETRVFDADGPHGMRFTLDVPWTTLLLDDAKVIHETTPIQPVHAGVLGWRDTLVVTLRAGGFQGP